MHVIKEPAVFTAPAGSLVVWSTGVMTSGGEDEAQPLYVVSTGGDSRCAGSDTSGPPRSTPRPLPIRWRFRPLRVRVPALVVSHGRDRGLSARLYTTREGVRPRSRGCRTHARWCRVCLLDRGLVRTGPWGDTRETSLLPSVPIPHRDRRRCCRRRMTASAPRL